MFQAKRQLLIEWGDCDPAGIVFYPRYFAMFDASTARLFSEALGCSKQEMLKRYGIIGIPAVATEAAFSVPCRFGDSVTITSRVEKLGRTSIGIAHCLLRVDGQVAIRSSETRVWAVAHPTQADRILAEAMPAEVLESLRGA